MALVLSGSIDISGSMTATTILISSPGAAGMVSSSAQITELAPLMQSTSSINNLTGSLITTSSNNVIAIDGLNTYTSSLKGAAIVSSSQQIQNYNLFAQTSSANTFYGNQTITGSVSMTGSLRVGDWIGGSPHVDETARFDVRTTVDRGIKITGNVSSDVIITAYRGASDDLVRGMRLQANGIGIYIGDGNANTGSSVASFNTNGLAFEAGKGIDFSATSNSSGTTSSELLNDYETGTWSPQVYYQNGTDQTNSTNVTQVGIYTKVGNVVYASGVLQWTITGSPANDNIGIKNLPFTSKAGADYYNWGLVQLVNAGAYPTDGYVMMMQQNATMMLFYDRRADTSNYGDDIGASGTKTARFSITYLSA